MRKVGSVLAISVALAGCGPGLTINEMINKEAAGPAAPSGFACYGLDDSGASGTGAGSDEFSYKTVASDGVLQVEARSGDKVLATRRYDRAFARSGEVDSFFVVTEKGERWNFLYWGSTGCDSTPPQ